MAHTLSAVNLVLNSVAVSAAVDENGAITHWYDKESGHDLLSGSWHEEVGGKPIAWSTNEGDRGVVSGTWATGSKSVRVSYRGIAVTLDVVDGDASIVRSILPLNGQVVAREGSEVRIELPRTSIRVAVSGSAEVEASGGPVTVTGSGRFIIEVQVSDSAAA